MDQSLVNCQLPIGSIGIRMFPATYIHGQYTFSTKMFSNFFRAIANRAQLNVRPCHFNWISSKIPIFALITRIFFICGESVIICPPCINLSSPTIPLMSQCLQFSFCRFSLCKLTKMPWIVQNRRWNVEHLYYDCCSIRLSLFLYYPRLILIYSVVDLVSIRIW